MNKQTKRNRRNIKNKTIKYYGGRLEVDNKSKGIFDIIGDKLSGYSDKVYNYAKEKSLRLAGLQPIKQPEDEENKNTQEVEQKINEIGDSASGIMRDIKNVADKSSAAIIGNLNDVLKSPQVYESLDEALEETAEIGEKFLKKFNEKLSTPEIKQETKMALDNAADYVNIAVEAMDEPIDKAIDELNEAGSKAASGVASGLVKVGTDALAAVPGAGAIVDAGKMINDGTAAIGDVVDAASTATSTISKVVEETSKNIDEGLDKLHEIQNGVDNTINTINSGINLKPDINFKPDINLNHGINLNPGINLKPDINFRPDINLKNLNKDGTSISKRVDKSINQFENPVSSVPNIQQGGKKTRRKLLKRKGKSKRVRFSI